MPGWPGRGLAGPGRAGAGAPEDSPEQGPGRARLGRARPIFFFLRARKQKNANGVGGVLIFAQGTEETKLLGQPGRGRAGAGPARARAKEDGPEPGQGRARPSPARPIMFFPRGKEKDN